MGDLSEHFDSSEFRDRHDGSYKAPPLELVWRLEDLRSRIGRPLPIVSGYRSAATNRRVGGSRLSRHRLGRAVDVPAGLVRQHQAVASGFVGVGICRGWVVHLDVGPRTRLTIFADCPK